MIGFDGEAFSRTLAGAAEAMRNMGTVFMHAGDLHRNEMIAERARAFEHARMVACLIWPWPGREAYHLKDGL